ncbi:hypothetical protein CPLU01_01970 [Colletotrichum plurivorum]|uniref:Uncharacterized protein n=1 Tax=Colletotrichum plurivorum TaxID=2175906 RepID=A0A8H6KWZ6_9PEZI|nr:hypothetical protein CPLU01_01970 [Colletotrichum plurivorum]
MSLILETHIYSNPICGFPQPWSRSFHLRLSGPSAPKTEILALVSQALARLSRADPVVEGQITLYFTRNGRVASLPGAAAASTTTTTVALPVYQPTVQVLSVDVPTAVQVQQQPCWPLALTYAGGTNYLHSYSPSPTTLLTSGTVRTQMVVGGSQLSFLNVGIPNISLTCSPRPVVSDVVREVRLDTVAEDALGGLLEWAVGPTGLKLILVVNVDGRDVVPPVVTLPPPVSLPATPPVFPSVAPSVVSGTGTPPAPSEPEPEPPAPASPEAPAASA